MRLALVAILIVLEACSATPNPSAPVQRSVPGTALPVQPATSPGNFRVDVENEASVGVVVSVASDTATLMPGFEPGERGTISIPLLNPENGITVEIQGPGCRVIASGRYPSSVSFTLLVTDGPAGTVQVSRRSWTFVPPLPLPANSLVGCGG